MTHLGLFEGIGGFSLAARWMGWQTLAWCEWNDFGQRVLRHHFPEAEGFGDITKTNFEKYYGKIDIITGGFPCQPYSMAGKRKGKDDERHLWPEMLRVIREVSPRFVVGENVLGLVNWSGGLVFEEVQADLEAQGYEVLPFVLPAAGVGAPHRRDRVWFVARAVNTNADRYGLQRIDGSDEELTSEGRIDAQRYTEQSFINEFIADPQGGRSGEQSETDCRRPDRRPEHYGEAGYDTNPNDPRLEGLRLSGGTSTQGRQAADRPALEHPSFNERTLPATPWDYFPTKSPLCGGDDGLPDRLDGLTFSKWRNESIKAYGNAIVPQVALQIFKAIEETEKKINL